MNRDVDLSKFKNSKFRLKFTLDQKDVELIASKSLEVIQEHATVFIKNNLGADFPDRDGKQTPFKGHPAFKAQHATATCCRECLQIWHGINKGQA